MDYKVYFLLNNVSKSLEMNIDFSITCDLNEEEVIERIDKDNPSDTEIQLAVQVLKIYPEATKIQIYKNLKTNNGSGVNNGAVLLILGIVLGILFAPIFITLGMFGKFILKGFYKDRKGIRYKKFRKIALIISWLWFALCVALIVIGAIAKIEMLIMIPLYVLFGGNIAILVLSSLLSKKYINDDEDGVIEEKERSIAPWVITCLALIFALYPYGVFFPILMVLFHLESFDCTNIYNAFQALIVLTIIYGSLLRFIKKGKKKVFAVISSIAFVSSYVLDRISQFLVMNFEISTGLYFATNICVIVSFIVSTVALIIAVVKKKPKNIE